MIECKFCKHYRLFFLGQIAFFVAFFLLLVCLFVYFVYSQMHMNANATDTILYSMLIVHTDSIRVVAIDTDSCIGRL